MARMQRGSLRRGLVAVWMLMCVLAGVGRAQSSEAEIKARLVGKPLFLRGFWRADKLRFDSAGGLKGKSETESFTVSGVEIGNVKMDEKGLRLEGWRVGLLLDKQRPRRLRLVKDKLRQEMERIQIDIDAPPDGNYGPALSAAFADGLKELQPLLPVEWQHLVSTYLARGTLEYVRAADVLEEREQEPGAPPRYDKNTGSIQAPRVVHSAEPEFSEEARENMVGGGTLLSLVVEADGSVSGIRVEKAIGCGQDERAMDAVRQYKFAPAMQDGHAVPVLLTIEVDFSIYHRY